MRPPEETPGKRRELNGREWPVQVTGNAHGSLRFELLLIPTSTAAVSANLEYSGRNKTPRPFRFLNKTDDYACSARRFVRKSTTFPIRSLPHWNFSRHGLYRNRLVARNQKLLHWRRRGRGIFHVVAHDDPASRQSKNIAHRFSSIRLATMATREPGTPKMERRTKTAVLLDFINPFDFEDADKIARSAG